MPDQKPPQLVADERTTALELLRFQRESLLKKLDGLSEEDARRSPVASGTSLLWLAKHCAWAELIWVRWRFHGEDVPGATETVTPEDTVASVTAAYRAEAARVDAVILAADLDDLTSPDSDRPGISLRWILLHLLEEVARHAGHADILRELIDGETGR